MTTLDQRKDHFWKECYLTMQAIVITVTLICTALLTGTNTVKVFD